jgi:hypothetical protein
VHSLGSTCSSSRAGRGLRFLPKMLSIPTWKPVAGLPAAARLRMKTS